jgi:hypothetical protein
MATKEEVLAKAAEWEAAGNAANAAKLRAYAATLPDAPPAAPDRAAVEAKALEWEKAGNAANAAKLRAYAATLVAPEAPAPMAGPAVPMYADGDPRNAAPAMVATPPRADTFGETARAMTEGPMAAAGQFAGGLTGANPSPSREFLANDPLTRNLPPLALSLLGGVGDIGGAALSTIGAGISGATGLAAELMPGQGPQGERKLAEDLTGMAMFAVPELAGVSSLAGRAATMAPRAAETAAPRAAPNGARIASAIPPVATKTPEEVGQLAQKAASGGMGSVKAQEALAAEARINPEAKAAADRLGIDLPADVFSDSENVRATVGLTRSEVGKEPEAIWRKAVKDARDKADEIMAAMDGSPDIASVSEAVKGALQSAQASLKATASAMYKEVDKRVPKSTPFQPDNVVRALNEAIQDVGGTKGLSEGERALFEMVTGDQPVTYGRLMVEKEKIRAAKERGSGPYADAGQWKIEKLYSALVEDQLANVSRLGDDTLRQSLREANQLTAKQKALEKRIVAAFGSDLDGSIGAKLKSAVTTAAKGDIAGLQRILKVIPEDLRQSATASAIAAATRSARATEPGFGLSEFSKVVDGIRTNRPVFNLIGKTLGPDAMNVLKDLHTVAQRIAIADSNVLRTGKANQALVGALQADGIVGKVLSSTAGKRVAEATAIGAGSMVGGPLGGMVAGPMANALISARPDMLAKVGKLFSDDAFQKMMVEASQGNVSQAAIAAVNKSPAFRDWSRRAGVADAKELTLGFGKAVAPQAGAQTTAAPDRFVARDAYGRPLPAPDYEPLWQRYGGARQ